jgi:hypothetical protein
MGVAGGPDLIQDGLVLALDASDRNSYVSGSTTWFDLSGLNNSGSLINGPTFNTGSGGSIVFDGVDDYVTCGNSTVLQTTVGTISAWVYPTSGNSSYRGILVKQSAWGLFLFDNNLVTYDWGNIQKRDTGVVLNNNNWYHTAMTFTETAGTPSNNAILYVNGTAVLTTTVRNSNVSSQSVVLGTGLSTPNGQELFGRIAGVQIYNRALSASEILQNYNATKTRFGL